ncbi:hypothetical protein [Coralloluteibacterium thermophilus]|uniref:HNH endonuclease n=1 Tax=Coralloluteibacterium thermophilum TaxID=2707049 RepID=A0ABV9NIK2_9GAMM
MACTGQSVIHGHKRRRKQTPTYTSWNAMLARCQRPSCPSYQWYGGAGVRVCDRWQVFANFLADMGERPEGTTLDRIDNSRGYEPGNCRWSTPRQQSQNRSCVRPISFRGKSMTLREWAEKAGIKRSTLAQRIYVYRWPIEKALKEIT